jgi:hypothetical protein
MMLVVAHFAIAAGMGLEEPVELWDLVVGSLVEHLEAAPDLSLDAERKY